MLFPREHWGGLRDGSVTVAFRRWRRAGVRAGGTQRAAGGVLAIDAVERIDEDEVTDEDARRAGYDDRAAALAAVNDFDGELYRIRFHWAGDDPRTALAAARPDADEVAAIAADLAGIDRRSRQGPWTRDVLESIAAEPGTRAPDLAARLGRETLPFKRDVRRLKERGLTISLPVGYRLSPRGEAVLAHLRRERN